MSVADKEKYMQRCFELAKKGFRSSHLNPCVGAVAVKNGEIVGEGYYQEYGGAHAEIRCINQVITKGISPSDIDLFVSLEPCSIYGKTPPCASAIIQHKINKVYVSCLDPNPKIAGNGIKILQEAGIDIEIGLLKEEGEALISKFKKNVLEKLPWIALKWAQSADGFAGKVGESVWYTNEYSRIVAHKLRTKYEGILVGPNTANIDNPQLNNRLHFSNDQPIKIIIDRNERVKKNLSLFHQGEKSIIITSALKYENPNSEKVKILYFPQENWTWKEVWKALFDEGITSILVEGGPSIHKSIVKEDSWDEAHVLSSIVSSYEGIKAPGVTGKVISKLNLCGNHYVNILK